MVMTLAALIAGIVGISALAVVDYLQDRHRDRRHCRNLSGTMAGAWGDAGRVSDASGDAVLESRINTRDRRKGNFA